MTSQTCVQIVSTYSRFFCTSLWQSSTTDLIYLVTGTDNNHTPKSLDAYTQTNTHTLTLSVINLSDYTSNSMQVPSNDNYLKFMCSSFHGLLYIVVMLPMIDAGTLGPANEHGSIVTTGHHLMTAHDVPHCIITKKLVDSILNTFPVFRH
jgi:hypothetical protein